MAEARFEQEAYTVDENDGEALVCVEIIGELDRSIIVTVSSKDNTAIRK